MRTIIFLLAIACLSASAAAQDGASAPAVEEQEVVVTAARRTEDAIRDFVGALDGPKVGGHLSRFETRAACPTVLGVTGAMRDTIVRRMRKVAASAGVPLAGEKCRPNVLVMITRDKTAFLAALAKRYPAYLGGVNSARVRKLIATPGPAVAWQLDGPKLKADGVEMAADRDTGAYVNSTARGASRITDAARTQFAAAALVVEQQALVGLSAIQLADYAAMRTFVQTDPARLKGSDAPTILKMLDTAMGDAVPVTLTTWDLGLLKGLYGSPPNVYAPAQRSAIGRQLKDDLNAAAGK